MSAKQDRTHTRTASDLERKLNLKERFSEVMGIAEDARSSADEALGAKVGNNILTGTGSFTGNNWINMYMWSDDGTFNGFPVKTRVGAWQGLKQDINVVAGEVYTISAYVKSTGIFHFAAFVGNTGEYGATPMVYAYDAIPEWTRISNTFTATETGILAPGYESITNDGQLWICAIKVEKGNKATEWCPHLTETTISPESVFNALTNNGQSQGLFRGENGDLYINASYIVSGILASLNGATTLDLETGDLTLRNTSNGKKTSIMSGDISLLTSAGIALLSIANIAVGGTIDFTCPTTDQWIGGLAGAFNDLIFSCWDQETGSVESHTVSWKKINGVYTLVGE